MGSEMCIRDRAAEIFSKYLTPALPLHPAELDAAGGDRQAAVASMIERTVDAMFARSERTEFVEVTYTDGTTRILHFADFASGAVVANIVDRAKKHAIKQFLSGAGSETGVKGLQTEHLLRAVVEEFGEQEDLPNTTSPEDWARISGHRGGRVAQLRMLVRAPHLSSGEAPSSGEGPSSGLRP